MSTKNPLQPNLLQIQTNVSSTKALTQQGSILKSVGQNSLNQRYSNNSSGVYQVGLPQHYYNKSAKQDLVSKSTNNLNVKTEGSRNESLDKKQLARSICILSQEELQRIKDRVKLNDALPTFDREAERKRLHDLSMKRIDNWPDNLLQITQKKEKERFEKFEKLEREKRKIDEQEEAFQREKYRQIIKDANEKLFAQDPRVRQFKKQLLFTDVIQERKEQLELKKYKEELTKDMDTEQNKFLETMRKQQDEEKKQLQQKKLLELQEMRQELAKQLQEMKDKKISSIQNDFREGQLIKERANEEYKENIEKKIKLKEKNKKILQEMDFEQQKRENYLNEQKLKEQQEDSKMNQYIENKSQLVEMRKLRENEKIKEKIQIRQRLYDFQLSQMKAKVDNEDNRLANQMQKQLEKEEREREEKERELSKRREDIKESIRESIELKKVLQEQKKRKENEFASQLLQQSKIIEQGEKEEKEFHKKRIQNIRQFQIGQIDEKKRNFQDRYSKELEEDQDLRNSIEIDKRIFKSWAESAIEEWKESGKDIKPLIKELTTIDKNY